MSVEIIRQQMRQRRKNLSSQQQQEAAIRLAENVCSSEIFLRSQHIAVYLAIGGEIDLTPIIRRAWDDGKQCYLPVVTGQQMRFIEYSEQTSLVANRFGILEPDAGDELSAQQLDLVLTPLVAFDQNNHRIGMGGGFYDRTFSDVHKSQWSVFLMGVAHECQRVESITPQAWDVPLHDIVAG